VQLVTSAFRDIPASWAQWDRLNTVVSIDGLAAEHDVRRKPATYARILRSIAGARVTVHCTITAQMMQRAGYLEEFLQFWTPRPEIKKVWFSLFTPQRGDVMDEILSPAQRRQVVRDLLELRQRYSKLDMARELIEEFAHPPASPEDCIFAQTTRTISADMRTVVTPCQFGGNPDCSQCGCIASMGLAAIGHYRLGGFIPVGSIFHASARIGRMFQFAEENPTRLSNSTNL
jgi:sulfatase maturation enzyme AslB (radical SAM superfamily)